MGYYTKYSLTIEGAQTHTIPCPTCGGTGESKVEETANILSEKVCDGFILLGDVGDESLKWYEWKDDMKRLSVKYPRVTFILDGEGEEQGDVWQATIKNGHIKMKRAKVELAEVEE